MHRLERIGTILESVVDLLTNEVKYIPVHLAAKRNIRVTRQALRNGELDRSMMVNYRRSVPDIAEASRAIRSGDKTGMKAFSDRLRTLPQRVHTLTTEEKAVYSYMGIRLGIAVHRQARKRLWSRFKKSIGLK